MPSGKVLLVVQFKTSHSSSAVGVKLAKRRSGSETRKRTESLTIRLLPSEHRALRLLADQAGHRSLQAWILEEMGPHLERVSHRIDTAC